MKYPVVHCPPIIDHKVSGQRKNVPVVININKKIAGVVIFPHIFL